RSPARPRRRRRNRDLRGHNRARADPAARDATRTDRALMTATIPVQAISDDAPPPTRRPRRWTARPGSFAMPNPIKMLLWIWVVFNIFMAVCVGLNALKTDREIFGA